MRRPHRVFPEAELALHAASLEAFWVTPPGGGGFIGGLTGRQAASETE